MLIFLSYSNYKMLNTYKVTYANILKEFETFDLHLHYTSKTIILFPKAIAIWKMQNNSDNELGFNIYNAGKAQSYVCVNYYQKKEERSLSVRSSPNYATSITTLTRVLRRKEVGKSHNK